MAYFATHAFARRVLNTMRGQTASGFSQLWVGLFLNDPTATGIGSEIPLPRQPIGFTPPAMLNNQLSIQNTGDITWEAATDPAIATHIGIFDSPTGGVMQLRGSLTVPLELRVGQQPSVLQGDIVYWIRGDFSRDFSEAILNILRGVALPTFEARIAMHNGNPETGGTELSGDNYSRPAMTFTEPVVDESGVMMIANDDVVRFPVPMGVWGNWVVTTAMRGTGSEIVGFRVRDTPDYIHRGYVGRIPQGNFRMRLS